MNEPVAEIRFSGDVEVRAFRRGTYLGRDHLETLIERALGPRYRFGDGWQGVGVVSIALYEQPPGGDDDADGPDPGAAADAGSPHPARSSRVE